MKKRAFTLVEVMVASGIFAIVCLVCMKLSSGVLMNYQAQKERSHKIQELITLDKTFRKMISNMVPFSWRDEDDFKVPFFVGLNNTMRFAQLNRINRSEDGGMRFVELSLNENNQLVAYYQTRPFTFGTELTEGKSYLSILGEEIESVEFFYVSAEEGTNDSSELIWLEEWQEMREDIPLAVLMKIRWLDQSEENFMWRTSGNSYYERRAGWDNWKVKQ